MFKLVFLFLVSISPIQTLQAFDILQPLPDSPITPADKPVTPAKSALGKQLYFDKRLSGDGQYACQSCHDLTQGGDDNGRVTRLADRNIRRSAPPIWNSAYQTVLFWDGRAKSLEIALEEHLFDPNIMAMKSEKRLENKLTAIPGYVSGFKAAFDGKSLDSDKIIDALASFVRSLKTPGAPIDRYLQGDKHAISAAAKRGETLFNDTGCLACHFGINLAGPAPGPAFGMGDGFYELFPNYLGSQYDRRYDLTSDDGRIQVTGDPGHRYMWRVPPLRNIEYTAPYFHNGSVDTLEEAVRVMARTQLNKSLNKKEISDIVAFLQAFSGHVPEMTLPRVPDTVKKQH